jgi:PAS domain S-box-containing protein
MLGISVDVTQSKQVEQALRESDQRFRLAIQAGKMYSFDWDVTTGVVVRSPEHVKILGVTEPLRFTHQQFVDKVHPDDRQNLLATIAGLTPENPTAVVIFRMLVPDGVLVWLRSSGRAFFDGEGRMLRVIGMVADVSDLKRAEEALLGINRKLIEAQEQERSRIGRELHDDINQKVALLAVNLQTLKQDLPAFKKKTGRQIVEICERVADLGSDIQALSHRLHSSKLEYLGLEAAAASFCREFSMAQNAETTFRSENIPKEIPAEAALCLFRVLQEALQNAAKHSGVKQFEVSLKGNLNEIQLTVRDLGVGFDAERVTNEHGLGLTSMRERLKLVGGQLSIASKPVRGTTIQALVPLSPKRKSAGADG